MPCELCDQLWVFMNRAGFHEVTVDEDEVLTGVDFGNWQPAGIASNCGWVSFLGELRCE